MLDQRHKWHIIANLPESNRLLFQCLSCKKEVWKFKDLRWPYAHYFMINLLHFKISKSSQRAWLSIFDARKGKGKVFQFTRYESLRIPDVRNLTK